MKAVVFDHSSDDASRSDEFVLAYKLIKGSWPHTGGERRLAIEDRLSSVIEQSHD